MWKLLLIPYLVMAFFVGDSRARCGERRDAYGLVDHSWKSSLWYGAIWPVSIVIYWGQHGSLGDFFSRSDRSECA